MDGWWDALLDRLLEQEDVEDYYYEHRIEPESEYGERFVRRMYPTWWAIQKDRWDDLRRLCKKGYSLAYRDEEEPHEEGRCLCPSEELAGTDAEIYAYTARNTYSWIYGKLVRHAIDSPIEEVKWLCDYLEEFFAQWSQGGSDSGYLESILHDLRLALCLMQNGHAYDQRMEDCLDAFYERLPRHYHWFFCDQGFWFDICSNTAQNTLGLPSFPMLERCMEYYEMLERDGLKERQGELRWLAETEKMSREAEWERALGMSIGKLLGAASTREEFAIRVFGQSGEYVDSKAEEYVALFERMNAFFRKHCADGTLRKLYEDALYEQYASCQRWAEEDEKMSEWYSGWAVRFQKGLAELEGVE